MPVPKPIKNASKLGHTGGFFHEIVRCSSLQSSFPEKNSCEPFTQPLNFSSVRSPSLRMTYTGISSIQFDFDIIHFALCRMRKYSVDVLCVPEKNHTKIDKFRWYTSQCWWFSCFCRTFSMRVRVGWVHKHFFHSNAEANKICECWKITVIIHISLNDPHAQKLTTALLFTTYRWKKFFFVACVLVRVLLFASFCYNIENFCGGLSAARFLYILAKTT